MVQMFEKHSFSIRKSEKELANLYTSGGTTNAEDIKAEFMSKDNFNASSQLLYSLWIQEIVGRTFTSYKNI